MQRRQRLSRRVGTARRKLSTTTAGAVEDFERSFKKALWILALLMAAAFLAKQSGGLVIPVHLVIHLEGEQSDMPPDDHTKALPKGSVPKHPNSPSTIRLGPELEHQLREESRKLGLSGSALVRRILKQTFSDSAPIGTATMPIDAAVRSDIATLQSAVQDLHDRTAALCGLIESLHRDHTGQNKVLEAILQARVGIVERLESDAEPTDPTKLHAFVQNHLPLRERDE